MSKTTVFVEKLKKFQPVCHEAIVEIFVDLLEDGEEDLDIEEIEEFLKAGLGISKEADKEINDWIESFREYGK